MLTQLKKVGTEVHRATNLFATYVGKNKVKCPGDVKKFIFLCGANKNNGEPSARRIELIDFLRNILVIVISFLLNWCSKSLVKMKRIHPLIIY
ncbi:Uncharacterised protein [Salmonella enterica subsp. enterica]|nr:Uncharacterised protein [Salmonella enterica subsp. enterica]